MEAFVSRSPFFFGVLPFKRDATARHPSRTGVLSATSSQLIRKTNTFFKTRRAARKTTTSLKPQLSMGFFYLLDK